MGEAVLYWLAESGVPIEDAADRLFDIFPCLWDCIDGVLENELTEDDEYAKRNYRKVYPIRGRCSPTNMQVVWYLVLGCTVKLVYIDDISTALHVKTLNRSVATNFRYDSTIRLNIYFQQVLALSRIFARATRLDP